MPSPKPDIRALERDHPNMRQQWTMARSNRDIRQAIEALPPNLFDAIWSALDENNPTPFGLAVHKAIDRRWQRGYKRHLAANPD